MTTCRGQFARAQERSDKRTQHAHDILPFADLLHDRRITVPHRPLLRLINMPRMELNLVRDIPRTLQPWARDEVDHLATERGRAELVYERDEGAEQPEVRPVRAKLQMPRVSC